jgi:hypothetical protein
MESKDEIGPSIARQLIVRAGLPLDAPADPKK